MEGSNFGPNKHDPTCRPIQKNSSSTSAPISFNFWYNIFCSPFVRMLTRWASATSNFNCFSKRSLKAKHALRAPSHVNLTGWKKNKVLVELLPRFQNFFTENPQEVNSQQSRKSLIVGRKSGIKS